MTKELTEAEKAQNVSTILGISLNEERKTSQLYLEKVNELRAELASLRARTQEPGDLISRAIEFIESDHDLDTRSEVLAKLREILSAPSGPLSDPELKNRREALNREAGQADEADLAVLSAPEAVSTNLSASDRGLNFLRALDPSRKDMIAHALASPAPSVGRQEILAWLQERIDQHCTDGIHALETDDESEREHHWRSQEALDIFEHIIKAPASSVGELEWRRSGGNPERQEFYVSTPEGWSITRIEGNEHEWRLMRGYRRTGKMADVDSIDEAKSLANSLQRILSGAAE